MEMTETTWDLSTITDIANTTIRPSRDIPLTFYQILYRSVIPFIGAAVILLNGLVVFSSGLLLQRHVQPRSTYLFLGNIALCDFITGISVVVRSAYPKQWRHHSFCCIQIGFIVASTLASVWSVGLVAVDRFFYIIHGMRYSQLISGSRVRWLISATWIVAGVFGFIPLFLNEKERSNDGVKCWLVLVAPKPLLVAIVILGLIPLTTNAVLYFTLLFYSLRRITRLKEAERKGSSTINDIRINRSSTNESNSATKWKAIKVVGFTTGAYCITIVPYMAVFIPFILCETQETCNTIAALIAGPLAILVFLNSLLNPIIYAWWHEPFRRNAASILGRKKPSKQYKKSTSSTRSTSVSKSEYEHYSAVHEDTHL